MEIGVQADPMHMRVDRPRNEDSAADIDHLRVRYVDRPVINLLDALAFHEHMGILAIADGGRVEQQAAAQKHTLHGDHGADTRFEADFAASVGKSMASSGCEPMITGPLAEREIFVSRRLGMRAVITSPEGRAMRYFFASPI